MEQQFSKRWLHGSRNIWAKPCEKDFYKQHWAFRLKKCHCSHKCHYSLWVFHLLNHSCHCFCLFFRVLLFSICVPIFQPHSHFLTSFSSCCCSKLYNTQVSFCLLCLRITMVFHCPQIKAELPVLVYETHRYLVGPCVCHRYLCALSFRITYLASIFLYLFVFLTLMPSSFFCLSNTSRFSHF